MERQNSEGAARGAIEERIVSRPQTLEDLLADPAARVERKIWRAVRTGESPIFVTGPAGTGKSHLLRLLAGALRRPPVILAPTGIAALGVGGQTIHSFFRLRIGVQEGREDGIHRPERLYRSISTLILDEFPMLRADILDMIDFILRKHRTSDVPFGGVQVIGFGDPFQLPPVEDDEAEPLLRSLGYDGPWFLDAKVADSSALGCYTLDRIHRQKDRRFVRMLNAIRVGDVSQDVLAELNTRVFPESFTTEAGSLVLTTHCWLAELRNEQRLLALPTEERTYLGRVKGYYPKKWLPVPQALKLRPGARALFVRNDAFCRWVNGMLGTVLCCEKDHVVIERDGGLGPCMVFPVKWTRQRHALDKRTGAIHREVVGQYVQLPVVLGWATTIHKSQGQTLDRCHVDLGPGTFAAGQTYVALSRCRTLNGLTLQRPVTRDDLINDRRIIEHFGPSGGERAA